MKENVKNLMKYKFVYTFLVIIIVLYYALNLIIPFFCDDIQFMFSPVSIEKNGIFSMIMSSVVHSSYTARYLCNLFELTAVNLWGEFYFNIINTLLFLSCILMAYHFIFFDERDEKKMGYVWIVLGLLSLSTGEDCLYYWAAGAANYLFPLCLTLAFILLLRKQMGSGSVRFSWLTASLFIIGFFLNLQHEMFVVSILGGLFFYLFYQLRKHQLKEFLNWNSSALIGGAIIACLCLLFLVDPTKRAGVLGIDKYSLADFVRRFASVILELRYFYIFLLLSLYAFWRHRTELRIFCKDNILIICIVLCGIIPAFIGGRGARALFVTELFSFFLIVKIFYGIYFNNDKRSRLYLISVCLSFFVIIYQGLIVYNSHIKWNIYNQMVLDYFKKDNGCIVVEDYKGFYITRPYTVNLNNLFSDNWCVSRIERLKKWQIKSEDVSNLAVMPKSILVFFENNKTAFSDTHYRVDGNAGFIHIPNTDYFVAPYSEQLAENINKGLLSIKSNGIGERLETTVILIKEQLPKMRMVTFINDPIIGKYIIFNNYRTHIPFFQVTSIYLEKEDSHLKLMNVKLKY
ncbi:MAG: hypothetical protein H6Q13_2646 [Bacteroidetes bacterium]|nr:hypothetical protein [Bacteroidota bacterium]